MVPLAKLAQLELRDVLRVLLTAKLKRVKLFDLFAVGTIFILRYGRRLLWAVKVGDRGFMLIHSFLQLVLLDDL